MSHPDQQRVHEAQALCRAAIDAARGGELTAALANARRAHAMIPRDLNVIVLLGDLLRRAGFLDEARSVLETGKALAPDDPGLCFQLGGVYRAMGSAQNAKLEFRHVLAHQPAHRAAREALLFIEIAERNYEAAAALAEGAPAPATQSELYEIICVEAGARGDEEAAQAYGRLAFERLPNAQTAMTLARADYHAGADADAEQRLHWLLERSEADATLCARAIGTLADIADRRGDFASAFQHYVASKRALKEDYERSNPARAGAFPTMVERLAASAAQMAETPPSTARPAAGHVFLLGFPRTGTTLLEQCPGGHPDIVTSDEIDALRSAVAPCLNSVDPFGAIETGGEAEREAMRAAYWRRIDERAPARGGKVFVDKMPFNSVFAGFIPFLFPSARIIFAVRDPRDVVFSCFRRRFGMNSATYEFCTFPGSVRLYCSVMRLYDLTRAKLSLPDLACRYEDVVQDLPATVGGVCDFIGVDWREDLARFGERAKQRPLSTVSAPQLSQGLYDGSGSWRDYEQFLAPDLAPLASWNARLGYS